MKRKKILYNLASFCMLIILVFPYLIFAQGVETPAGNNLPNPPGGIKAILTNVLSWILGIIGMIAIISFTISGFQYFFSAGDDKRMETAKNNLTYSIIGIIVALSGLIIVNAVDVALRGTSTTF